MGRKIDSADPRIAGQLRAEIDDPGVKDNRIAPTVVQSGARGSRASHSEDRPGDGQDLEGGLLLENEPGHRFHGWHVQPRRIGGLCVGLGGQHAQAGHHAAAHRL
eukprot:6825022-Prorocentrum_lima.AAC.1